jgi:hypothetical protein
MVFSRLVVPASITRLGLPPARAILMEKDERII